MRQLTFLFVVFLFLNPSFGQESELDSLQKYPIYELYEKYSNLVFSDQAKARIYAQAYLKKGKTTHDNNIIISGYKIIAETYKNTNTYLGLTYIDSAIVASKKTPPNKNYPALLFILKGSVLEELGQIEKALDSYFEAIASAKTVDNKDLFYYTSHNIGAIKKKLKSYSEAKDIFKNCLNYEIKKKPMTVNDSISYLISLSELVNSYRLNNQIDSTSIYIKKGLKWSEGKPIHSLFRVHQGIALFYNNQFELAKNNLENGLKDLIQHEVDYFYQNDDLIYAYTYLGKLNHKLSLPDEAIENFKKADSVVKLVPNFDPYVRTAYLDLIEHYKKIENKDLQLETSNKLLYVDSIINANYHFISKKILRDYDTPNIIADKEEQIESLYTSRAKTKLWLVLSLILLVLTLVVLMYHYKKQIAYKKRFEALMAKNSESKQPDAIEEKSELKATSINIAPEVVNSILEQLQQFEHTQGFLEKQITTNILASKFKTNTKYLSKVIRAYKQKSFVNYINNLRIDYFMKKIQNDKLFRRYTIKALAQECGFNTTEAFSKTFYKNTGIYPSYYIKQMDKAGKTNENMV